MAKQTINIGTTANDGTGDTLRNAFDKVNDNFDELYNGNPRYKIYRALVSQPGTSAPTAIVLENTFGQVPTYSYIGVGGYYLTFTGNPLTDNKTIPSETSTRLIFNRLINEDGIGDTTYGYVVKKISTNVIQINSFDVTESFSNDVLQGSLIEIITYNQ